MYSGWNKKIQYDFPYDLDESLVSLIKFPKYDLEFDLHNDGRNKSIIKNTEILIEYFQLLNNAKENQIGDVGLSSGFDCRLILALTKNTLKNRLHIHSHNTNGVHDKEIKYAKEIAKIYGSGVNLIPTLRIEDSDEEIIKETLKENVSFFDGNSARHLGSFSQTYTSWYKNSTMGNSNYSLNGLGNYGIHTL